MCKPVHNKSGVCLIPFFMLLGLWPRPLDASGDSLDFPGQWDRYPAHYEYMDFLHYLDSTYPSICQLDTIGNSVSGRPIMAMKITDHPDLHEPEPVFYYTSTMHGDEPSGFMLLLRLMDHLCRNYGKDSLSTRLVNHMEIWINPLANPDGTYRSNDSLVSNPIRENMNGKDLNRNFPSPVSGVVDQEPETRAQMEFMKDINLVLAANLHDGAEVFNHPWDTWYSSEKVHPDQDWYIWAGRKYVDTVYGRSYPVTGYMSGFDSGITHGADWYKIYGGRQDYVNYFLHAREVTLELNNDKYPNEDDLAFLWHTNHPSLLQYMENALFGIHGIVSDALTGNPVKAMIKVAGHDRDESHVFSDSASGHFARLIEAGTWTLEFTADGYESRTVADVQVEWDMQTLLDVRMESLAGGMPLPGELEAWPNPWTRELRICFDVQIPGPRLVVLTGMDGKIRLKEQFRCPFPGFFTYRLGHTSIEPGWYILQLISPEGVYRLKVLKSE